MSKAHQDELLVRIHGMLKELPDNYQYVLLIKSRDGTKGNGMSIPHPPMSRFETVEMMMNGVAMTLMAQEKTFNPKTGDFDDDPPVDVESIADFFRRISDE